jgi:hypothetical protein
MSYREPIADPEGLIVFDRATDIQIQGNPSHSIESVEILPYTAVLDDGPSYRSADILEIWAGRETYYVPTDAEYRKITDLSLICAKDRVTDSAKVGTHTQQLAES